MLGSVQFPNGQGFLLLSHDVHFEAVIMEISAKIEHKLTGNKRRSINSLAFHVDLLIDALDLNTLDTGLVHLSKPQIRRVLSTY